MWFVRAPDHLGDAVLALPLVEALAKRGPVTVAGPAFCTALMGHLATVVPASTVPVGADTAVLLKPAFRAAWQCRHLPRRVGIPGDWRRWLLTHPVAPPKGHRLDVFAALGRSVDVETSSLPCIVPPKVEVSKDILLVPFSASGPTVEWPHYRALADQLAARGHSVRFVGGPGEELRLAAQAGPHGVLPTLGVLEVAGVLAGARLVVGNDSGLVHLAAAARRGVLRPVHDVVGIVGSTDVNVTLAPGVTPMSAARPSCAPCFRKTCPYNLECLRLPVSDVLALVLDRMGDTTRR